MQSEQSQPSRRKVTLSLVIPVYNGGQTIGGLARRISNVCTKIEHQIVLVNDGSQDNSECICRQLAEEFPTTVTMVHLSRNFGEHNAVLAGLAHTTGDYVAVLDDDGQNPPEEVLRMLEELRLKNFDVVYGHYLGEKSSWLCNLASKVNDRMATVMLHKPAELYISSFKVMNRFVVNEVIKYRGAFPFIEGLIYRTTHNIGQILVEHQECKSQTSRYGLRKLVRVWLNMFLNFSITPLRLSVYVGLAAAAFSVLALGLIWIDKIYFTKNITPGIRTTFGIISLFSGIQLMLLGLVGEYLGRLYLDHTGTPQFITRYVLKHSSPRSEVRSLEG